MAKLTFEEWSEENFQGIQVKLFRSFAATDYAWDHVNLVEFHEALINNDFSTIKDLFWEHQLDYAKKHLDDELLRQWQKHLEQEYDE